jgi:hypothetical protein
MPTYTFRNKLTGVIIESHMKMAEKDMYLDQHPELESIIDYVPNIGDPVAMGVKKIDGGFKEVLSRIKKNNPGSTIDV